MKNILLGLFFLFSFLFIYRITYVELYEDLENIIPKFTNLDRFEDIKHVLYINLDERTDRREQAEQEFKRVGLQAQRIQAIKKKRGQLGCTLSHIKCLEIAKEKDWDHVMICEDDILFAKDAELVRQRFNTFLSRHKDWDVIALGLLIEDGVYLDDSAAHVKSAYCTTCYIVRKEYYDVLLNNFKNGAKRLEKRIAKNEIDQFWKSLQKRDLWMTILPIIVIQAPSKSSIQKSNDIPDNQKVMNDTLMCIKKYPTHERIKSAKMFY
jgi:GR25 family glycosyltransferase involved in LPS biosynthesis